MSKWLSRLSHRTKQLGWKGAAKTIIYNNILRTGELVGVDRMGNHYYEAKDAQNGRQRWVEGTHYYFDASEVDPVWHRWLHYVADEPPSPDMLDKIAYAAPHRSNLTGTTRAYRPSSYVFQKHHRPVAETVEPVTADMLTRELRERQ